MGNCALFVMFLLISVIALRVDRFILCLEGSSILDRIILGRKRNAMSTQQTDVGKNQFTLLQPRASLHGQNVREKVLNWWYRISALAGALVFLLSITVLLPAMWVKLQQMGRSMGGFRREASAVQPPAI